jgi:hypothetical protein
LGVYSQDGKLVKLDANTFNAALDEDTFRKIMAAGFPCQKSLDLPPGTYFLRLGVRDSSTGATGTANASLTVPAAETSQAEKPK